MENHDSLGPEGSYFDHKVKNEDKRRQQVTNALFPLMILVLFLILGFGFHLWHPGWLLFLTIPLQYMHFESRLDQLTNPVMITIIYLILGFFFHLWHPGWMIFFVIPISAVIKHAAK